MNYLEKKFHGVCKNYSGIQQRYDNYVQFKFADSMTEHIQPYLDKNKMVLDIGSGFGSFVYLLKKKGHKAYGVEISDFLVEFARQRLQKDLGVNHQNCLDIYRKESALNLPFPDRHFDIITIWNVLEHIADYKTALSEAIRTLKPNGKLFISNVNYAFCFIEPHYRVPWLPFLPKKIAVPYLKLLGRNTDYIQNGIFYANNLGIIKTLLKEKMHLSNTKIEKISENSPIIISRSKRLIWKIVTSLKIKQLLKFGLQASLLNPFCYHVNIIATKHNT